MAVDVGPRRMLLPPLVALTRRKKILSTANLRPEELYCAKCSHLIYREPFQPYRSNADFSWAEHGSDASCAESAHKARVEQWWVDQGKEPDIVY